MLSRVGCTVRGLEEARFFCLEGNLRVALAECFAQLAVSRCRERASACNLGLLEFRVLSPLGIPQPSVTFVRSLR